MLFRRFIFGLAFAALASSCGKSPERPADAIASGSLPLYATCAACHAENGRGVPGVFPALDARLAPLSRNAEGRAYLALLVRLGSNNHSVIDGVRMKGTMPALSPIFDEAEISGILNFVTANLTREIGKSPPPPFTEQEIKSIYDIYGDTDQGSLDQLRSTGLGASAGSTPPAKIVRTLSPATSKEETPAHPSAAETPTYNASGRVTFERCAACHLADGRGVPGAFPPLGAQVRRLSEAQSGRKYLILAVSKGLAGPLTVDGQQYDGVMPPHSPGLSHQDIADVLNYVQIEFSGSSFSTEPRAFTLEEVASILSENADVESAHVAASRPRP